MSYRTSLADHVAVRRALDPQDASAGTLNGPAIDRTNFDSAVLVVSAGTASGGPSAQTVDGKLQDSADGATGWADITGAAITQITADSQVAKKGASLASVKKFVRAVIDVGFTGGTTPAIEVSSVVLLAGHKKLPA